MKDVIDNFGRNAGKVWKALTTHGSLTPTSLMKTARLTEKECYAAIGWLAKENKIYTDGTNYYVGETNLTPTIGENAGKMWRLLDTWGELDDTHLPKLAGINSLDAYSALGWLAREGKLNAKTVKVKTSPIKFELK